MTAMQKKAHKVKKKIQSQAEGTLTIITLRDKAKMAVMEKKAHKASYSLLPPLVFESRQAQPPAPEIGSVGFQACVGSTVAPVLPDLLHSPAS